MIKIRFDAICPKYANLQVKLANDNQVVYPESLFLNCLMFLMFQRALQSAEEAHV